MKKSRSLAKQIWIASLALALFPFLLTSATYFEALDDSILHKINWAGILPEDKPLDESLNTILMTTARKEKYKCILPKPQDTSKDDGSAYTGPNPIELISPLFTQFVCTFKLETYWTYELCHGKYIRQYHEEREGKKVKLQEYYLGRWDKEALNTAKIKFATDFSNPDYKNQLPIKRIEGVNMPALQLNMSDGTLCDLNGQPRNTRVLYVCDPRGKHELYSLEEVSTCEYEIVVLSPLLCDHPDFKSKETGENLISCHALENSPQTPKALSELDNESFKIRHEHLLQNLESLLETKLKSESKPMELSSDEDFSKKAGKPVFYDNSFLSSFLSGKECLTGGSHWWKFEFCYGKHVLQYHEEHEGGSRTQIMLGKWDEDKHKEWSDKNPHKKPSVSTIKKTIYHYYTGGAQCDQTGQPRTVEVKFRCVDHPSPSSVSLYLMEPKTCEYTLTVESGLFCPLLKSATSDYGFIDTAEFVRSKSSYKNSAASKSKLKKLKPTEGDITLGDDDVQPGGWA